MHLAYCSSDKGLWILFVYFELVFGESWNSLKKLIFPSFKFYIELWKAVLDKNMKPCGQRVCAAEYGVTYKHGKYTDKVLLNIDTLKPRTNSYSNTEKLR